MSEGMFFRVDGADIESGDETFLVLRAASSEEAEELARKQGLLIASVRPATPEDWAAKPGDATTLTTPDPIALVDEEPPQPVRFPEPIAQMPADQPEVSAIPVTRMSETPHNGLSVFATGQALAAQATADEAMARPSMGTTAFGNVTRTMPPPLPPTKPAASAVTAVPPPASPTSPVAAPVPPRPLAAVRPPIPPRRPPAVSPVIASPKPHGIVAQNRARLANSPPPARPMAARPVPVASPTKLPPPPVPMPSVPSQPVVHAETQTLAPPPIPAPQVHVDVPPAPEPPAEIQAPSELRLEIPAPEPAADIVDLSPVAREEAPSARVWEHASSLVAGAVVLTPPRIEPPTPSPAPLAAPTIAKTVHMPETVAVVAPPPPAIIGPSAPTASRWVVTVLLCPLALLTVFAGVSLPVYYTLNHPEPAGATDLQKIDLHLQSLDQYFLGGALVLAGLMLFVTAGLVYLGGAMKALRTRRELR